MAILEKMFTRAATTPEKRSLTNAGFFRGSGTYTGKTVTPENALTVPAAYACIRVISETLASLPLIVYERLPVRGKRRASEFPLYTLLHDSPNELMTSFEYREVLQAHLLTHGNALSEVIYNGRGGIEQMWPLKPQHVHQVKHYEGQLYYYYQRPDMSFDWIPGSSIWHLKGLGSDGLWGYSPIQLMKQSMGISLATEEFAGRFFGSGAQPSGVLKHPGVLGEKAYDRLAGSWAENYGGLSNAHKTLLLEEGTDYQQISIPPEDAQFLETRQFQVTEVARIYNVPPHKIQDLTRSTNNNIEQQSTDFIVNTMRPWLVRWEQSIQKNLMLSRYKQQYFAEFLVDGLLRGDAASRHSAYSIGRQNGYYSANDVREMENLNPIDDGDMYLVPLNMVPASQAGQAQAAPPPTTARALVPGQVTGENEIEIRAIRAANKRQNLQTAYLPVYSDVLARILRREINDVGAGFAKIITKNGGTVSEFMEWVRTFYDDHEDFVRKQLAPTQRAYVDLVKIEAMSEVGIDEANLDRFNRSYLRNYAARHAGRSITQLENGITGEGVNPETGIEDVFENWREVRPDGDAIDETVRVSNGASKMVYLIAGIGTIRWVTTRDSCPYCRQLNGKTIAITGDFLSAGESLEGEEGAEPLVPGRNIGHPPAHRGCDCMVVAGL